MIGESEPAGSAPPTREVSHARSPDPDMMTTWRSQRVPDGTMPTPSSSKVHVRYIGGWGRSGSTMLDLMLGQAPGIFSAGEIREIWQSGLVENRPWGVNSRSGIALSGRRLGMPGSEDGIAFPFPRS